MPLGFLAAFYRLVLAKLQRILNGPDPSSPEEDAFPPELDQKINGESTPPPEEHVDLRCIWGIEFYTPSHIDSLEARLQQLGWGKTQGIGARPDPIAWLRGLRRRRYSMSSLNLGVITTETSTSFFGPTKSVPHLPHSVTYAQGQLTSLSPSLISIVMCFTLEESFSEEINNALRTDRRSYKIPNNIGYSIYDPYAQKRDAINEIRQDLRNTVHDWFEELLPGVFSTGLGKIPTCDLIVSKTSHPLTAAETLGKGAYDYLRWIGFYSGVDSWKRRGIEGLIFGITDRGNHANISANSSDLKDSAGDYDGPHRSISIDYLNHFMGDTLQTWAILPLLDSYTAEISRDRIPDEDEPEAILDFLRSNTIIRSDIAALSSEISDTSFENQWTFSEAYQFTRANPSSREMQRTLGEDLGVLIRNQAAWLRETDRFTRENAAQYGSLLASVENIRLQKSLKRLTWVLAGLAVLAAVMPVIAAKCL